jgi:hypothetical protein
MNKGSSLHKWAKKNNRFEDIGDPVPAGGRESPGFDTEPDMDEDDMQLGHDTPRIGKGHGTYHAPKKPLKKDEYR